VYEKISELTNLRYGVGAATEMTFIQLS